MTIRKAVVLLTTVFGGAALVWRVVARRQSLPCPAWMSGLLENPYMNALAGAQTLLDRAGVREAMRVVDVGCGPGRLTIPAAERVGEDGEVTAIDIQPAMLERLRDRLSARSLRNVTLVMAGAGDGKLKPGYYDRALLVTVLGEIPDREAAMQEIASALRPGGLLSITEVLPDPHYQRRATVRRLADGAGLRFAGGHVGRLAYTFNFEKPASGVEQRVGAVDTYGHVGR